MANKIRSCIFQWKHANEKQFCVQEKRDGSRNFLLSSVVKIPNYSHSLQYTHRKFVALDIPLSSNIRFDLISLMKIEQKYFVVCAGNECNLPFSTILLIYLRHLVTISIISTFLWYYWVLISGAQRISKHWQWQRQWLNK